MEKENTFNAVCHTARFREFPSQKGAGDDRNSNGATCGRTPFGKNAFITRIFMFFTFNFMY